MAQSVGYVFPASFSQERLWILDQLEADGSVFNMPAAVHLVGPLDVAALGGALNEVVRRHEALRTTFRYSDEQLVQVIAPVLVVEVPVVGVGGAGGRERWAQALRLVEQQAVQPFDLASGPLLRAVLLRLGQDEHVLVVVLHHIVADGFSMGVLVGELSAAYAALARGEPVSLEPLAVQYADVAVWQRRQLQGARLEGELSYWRGQLRDAPVLQLATDRPRPAVQSYRGASQQVRWPDGLRQQLEALGRRHGASLFMVLLAGFEALLSRYSGQDDIVVGSLIANRTRPEVERLIGFFVNTLALRGDLSGDPSFAELLGRVRECCLGAYAHQQVPFEKLLVELQPERDLSRTPLFQAMLVLQSHAVPALQLPGVACRVLPVATRRANVDLTVWVTPEPDGLAVVGEYASDLFEPATVTRLLGHLRVLLEAAAADPALRLSELPLLGAAEREQVLVGFNQPTRPAGSTVGLQELFAAQAARTPDVPALLDATQRLTYRQLQQRANQLAHALRGLGVGPEVLVGVCLDRSVEAVVAVLGVLKAGGAWLPLDPAHPPARLGFVLADAGVGVLVSRQQLLDRLPGQALEGVPVVCLDSDYHQIAAQPDHDPAVNTSPDQLAYVIYTSGSTGKPKGVMIEHAAVVNYLSYAGEEFALQPGDRLLQFHSLTVDTSVEEIFSCLSRGATLVIRPESMIDSATAFVRGCSDLGITVLDLPTGYWHELTVGFAREGVTLPACVRLLIIAGEKALPDRLLRWQEHVGERVRLVNTYGPTETAIVATICDLPGAGGIPDGTRELPIGRPVPNLQAYVLDRHLSPVPVGVPGELHVGGVGLARGYLNRPQLTAERFVANPFSDDPPARLYKTGDLGRHLPDGSIEYLGRLDHQVKLRGFRIEPGEIEAVLAEHPRVREAAVIARDDGQDRRLVAYVVPADKGEPIAATLRKHVKATLPEYMAPSTFVTLDALPLTATGKIDRLALPDPSSVDAERAQRPFVAPRTPIEQALAEIFSAALGIERVGADDDFFELGGHSLGVIELLAKIRDRFQLEFPMRVLYETSTVASLAAAIESIRHSGMASAPTALNAVADFEREAVLDPDIRPADALPYTPTSDPAHVFLTGATGFLGVHLLYELLEQTGATIYCLVRAPDVEKGKLRIKEKMTSNRLWQQRYAARIVPVLGDLTKPRFGLSEQRFDELARMVDSVYHSGAYVNFVFPYSALRSTNVFGTHEAIRLASQGKLKPLHHISLTDVALRQDSDGRWVIDEEPATEYPRGIFMSGYAQTKWVAEKLVSIAQSRGLPVTIYRPGFIEGHSQTGFCNTSSELCLTLKGCIDLGMAPDHDMNFDVAPVDYASKAFVYLSRRPELFGRIFNAVNPNPVPLRKVTGWIDAAGYPLQRVPFEQWRRKVIDVVSGNPDHPLYPLLPYSVDEEIARMPLAFPTDCSNTLRGLEGSGISCAKIEPRLLQVCLDHLAEVGFLEPPQTRSPEPEPAMG